MEENLFAPPKAVVADVPQSTEGLRFFPVSAVKLTIMFIATFGLYALYWFYKNWALVRDRSEPHCWPWARALFNIFWVYSLFSFMRRDEKDLGTASLLAAGPLAIVYVLLQVTFPLPSPWNLSPMLAPLVLVPVQLRINRINQMVVPEHDKNSQFTLANWAGIVIGGLLWAMTIYGLTLGPQEYTAPVELERPV